MADAGCEVMRHAGIGPIKKWVDDHLFFRVQRAHLFQYNALRRTWHGTIKLKGRQLMGGHIWFEGLSRGGRVSDEFSEDCTAPIIDTVGSKRTQNQCQMYCISVTKVLDTSAMMH